MMATSQRTAAVAAMAPGAARRWGVYREGLAARSHAREPLQHFRERADQLLSSFGFNINMLLVKVLIPNQCEKCNKMYVTSQSFTFRNV